MNADGRGHADLLKKAFLAIEDLQAKLAALERSRKEPIAIVGMGCRFPAGPTTRRRSGGCCATASTPSPRSPPTAGTSTPTTTPTPTRPARCTRATAASSTASTGSTPRSSASRRARRPAWIRSSGCCWRWPGRRWRTPGIAADRLAGSPHRRLRRHQQQRLRAASARSGDDRDAHRRLHRHRQRAQRRGGPAVVRARPAGPEPGGRHGLLVVAGGGAPGLPEPARRRVRPGAGRRRQPDALARRPRSACRKAARCWRPTAGARPSTRRPTATCAAKAAAWSCSSGCPTRMRDGDRVLARDPRLGRQPGRPQQRPDRAQRPGPAGGDPRRRWRDAGVSRHEVDYVEAHGTGTPLGDPIEVQAPGAGASGRAVRTPTACCVGSVKTNIGHLEAAAGIAGLIKVVLALQHGEIPPHLHLQQPNPHIPWDGAARRGPDRGRRRGRRSGGRRLAGVSSFGFSGTNAHVVLEEAAAARRRDPRQATERPLHVLAAVGAGPSRRCRELARPVRAAPGRSSGASRWPTSATRPTAGARTSTHRLRWWSRRPEQRSASSWPRSRRASRPRCVRRAGAASVEPPKVAFLFTGPGLAVRRHGPRAVRRPSRSSAQALDRCDELLRAVPAAAAAGGAVPGRRRRPRRSHETAYTQPALFALEYALAELVAILGRRACVRAGPQRRRVRRRLRRRRLRPGGRPAAGRRARPADAPARRRRCHGAVAAAWWRCRRREARSPR